MMHEFLATNRDALAHRCRIKVGQRVGRSATEAQLQDGIPLFLDQLIRTLRVEQTASPMDSRNISGASGGGPAPSEVSVSAAQHGKDLLALGLTVDQVVHDYGDLCQAITDLAVEYAVPFEVDEVRTLNRCLDNAIADAVTEFSFQRDAAMASVHALAAGEKLGFLAHEIRNLLSTAKLAFSAAKSGHLSLTGATGTILERSLDSLATLIANSLEEVRTISEHSAQGEKFLLDQFISEIYGAAALSATKHGCTLHAPPVQPGLALMGRRDALLGAVANLLQNAFKFTKPGTEVLLSANASAERIFIEIADHCGGLRTGVVETMFLPFSQLGPDRSGIGLGLTIAKQSVAANGGELSVRNVPAHGCVFTISMPRHQLDG